MDTTVKLREGRYYAPGIGDDTRGLAVLLSVIDVMNQYDIETLATLFLAATLAKKAAVTCEELRPCFVTLKALTDLSQLMAYASAVSPPVVRAAAASSLFSQAPADTPSEPSVFLQRSMPWAGQSHT